MKTDNKIDLSLLDGLSPEEREVALEALKQLADEGESSVLEELTYGDFDEIPVDLDTFLDDPMYLGTGVWTTDEFTGERKCGLFPYWRDCLKKIFPDNLTTSINTLILTGPIGVGKTFVAVICQLYLLYRMLCMKDPYQYYGLLPSDKITFSMLNVTIDAARGVAWDKEQQLIQGSEWFMNHGTVNASRTAPTWQPDKKIELIFGSSDRTVIGRALFCSLEDELNFTIGSDMEKKKKKLRSMISKIDQRMVSRFMKNSYLPTLNIVISSKDTEQSFLDSYINTKRQNESTTTLIVDEPQWVIRTDKGTPDDPGSFYVAVGNKFLAHELLPVGISEQEADIYRQKGYKLVRVPPGYREQFTDNLETALTDIVGISTSSTTKYISGVRLNQIKTPEYRNPFTKDIIEVGNSPDDHYQYANFFDMSAINVNDISKPLFIHLDMSISGDKTGIAGVWITGRRPPSADGNQSKELTYKLAFSVSIKAPKGYQISFEKNRNFIRWLRDKGFAVKGVSADTFQSTNLLQELTSANFATKIISVDRVDTDKVCKPYSFLKSAIYEQRLKMYQKCDLLTDELVGLERMSTGKIDHTTDGINCLSGDTLVSLTDGREVSMEQLVKEYEEGKENFVYSFNHALNRIEPRKIEKAWCSGESDDLVEVFIDNSTSVVCTANHRFMLRDGTYKMAKDLLEGDSLMSLFAIFDKLVGRIEKLNEKRKVYDLTIEGTHNFALSNGTFVHNSKDQADALCGALYYASQFAEEYSYSYGDNIDASLQINLNESELNIKNQYIQELQDELQRMYMEQHSLMEEMDAEKQNEYNRYRNIANGIIVI